MRICSFAFILGILSSMTYAEDTDIWTFYDDPGLHGDRSWMNTLQDALQPIGDTEIKADPKHNTATVKGTFNLPAPTTNQVLRLRAHEMDAQLFCIEFSAGGHHYKIERNHHAGGRIIFSKNGQWVTDDRNRWQAFYDGLADLRISPDLNFMLSRGPMTLLQYPVAATPTNFVFKFQGRLDLFEYRELPLPEPYRDPHVADSLLPAASFKWKPTARDRRIPSANEFKLTRNEKGSVSLSTPNAKASHRVTSNFESRGPCVITCRITNGTHGAGIAFANYNRGQHSIYLAEHEDSYVLCRDPHNKTDVQNMADRGIRYTLPFHLRAIYGLDFIRIEASQDGKHWAWFDRHHLNSKYNVPELFIDLLLSGRMEGKSQSITVSHAACTEHQLLQDIPVISQEHMLDRILINQWAPADIRQAAAINFIQRLQEIPGRQHHVVQTIRELIPWFRPQRWDGQARTLHPELTMRRSGESMIAEGDLQHLGAAANLWHDFAFYLQQYRHGPDRDTPPELIRSLLYQSWLKKDWAQLRLDARRYHMLARPYHENQFATWMSDQADQHLDVSDIEKKTFFEKRHWPHPLRISSDRITMNMLGEMRSALQHDEPELACKVLIRNELNEQFVSTTEDEDLYKTAGIIVRDLIQQHPEMQKILIEKYNAVGMIRVGRAQQTGNAQTLERLAYQFAGTPASRKAQGLLGDRDLSTGDFASAIERFNALLQSSDPPLRNNLLAKRQLAEALQGLPPSGELTGSVSLDGGTFTIDQFKKLLAEVQQNTPRPPSAPSAPPTTDTAVDFNLEDHVHTNMLADIPFLLHETTVTAHHQDRLVLGQKDELLCINLNDGNTMWSWKPENANRASAQVRPLFVGDELIAILREKDRDALTRFNSNGDIQWQIQIEGQTASHPILHLGHLYLISRSAEEFLTLNRFNVETGSHEMRRRLIRHPRMEKAYDVIQPAFVGEHLIIAARGLVINCDHRGEISWIRRLPYAPYKADRKLLPDPAYAQVLPIDPDHAVICPPNAPEIFGIQVASGHITWRHPQPDRKGLVNANADRILLKNHHSIACLDPQNGTVRWQIPAPTEFSQFVHNVSNPLLQVRLDRIDADNIDQNRHRHSSPEWNSHPRREITWYDENLGSPTHSIRLPVNQAAEGNVSHAFTHGGHLYLLIGKYEKPRDRNPKIQLVKLASSNSGIDH